MRNPAAAAGPAPARPDARGAAAAVSPVLREWAAAVDREGRFPTESVDALRAAGLLGLVVPERHGGRGEAWTGFVAAAQELAAGCLSTAMVWVMHCQQVAAIAGHAPAALQDAVLPRVARGELLLAGVTGEAGGEGGLLSIRTPAIPEGARVRFEREAPMVTSGCHADAYLMLLRAGPDAPPERGAMLYAHRDQVTVEATGPWLALGMRATHSVPLRLSGSVPAGQLFGAAEYRDAVIGTLVPLAHLGWAAAWLGAAGGVVRQVVRLVRRRWHRGDPALADVRLVRLGRVRMRLDAAGSLLWSVAREYQRACSASPPDRGALAAPGFQIRVNELKVLASEAAFTAVGEAMELAGAADGYLVNERVPLERVYRDLRAASLMYSNDRLLRANGTLALLDTSLGSELM